MSSNLNLTNKWSVFLEKRFSFHPLHPAIHHLLCNPGKMIRAKLHLSFFSEELLSQLTHDAWKVVWALELHHTYTLIHDDLPAMDNDDFRRGQPSLHRAYNEATAILVGDVLSIESFKLLSETSNPIQSQLLTKIFSWCTGHKGLILGQHLDLLINQKPSLATFSDFLRMFELKTARLFQFALISGSILSGHSPAQVAFYFRLGSWLGITFQLLDDFDGLKTEEKSSNIFHLFPKESFEFKEKNQFYFQNHFCEKLQQDNPVLFQLIQEHFL